MKNEITWAEDALTLFNERLSESIQSPVARQVEASFLLGKLVTEIEAKRLEVDRKGNVYPSTLSHEDKQTIDNSSQYSLLEKPPIIDCYTPELLTWSTVGALICGDVVLMCDSFIKLNVDLNNAQIIDSTINITDKKPANDGASTTVTPRVASKRFKAFVGPAQIEYI
ncbi:MAG: hypothetical protein NVSMB46_03320 [Candidatus Saccharimonadales bacterium]